MPKGVLVLSGLSHVWKSQTCDLILRGTDGNGTGGGLLTFFVEEPHHNIRPTLQRLPFYCTSPTAVDAAMPNPTLEDLAAGNPSAKVVAKAEASQKRKASTSGATSSHVSKRTRSSLAQSSSSTTHPNLFAKNSDNKSDDDACVEISLVTPIHFAVVIPSSGNQSGGSTAPAAEGPRDQDSQGKGIMTDVVAASSANVSRPQPSSNPASSFMDISRDAINKDFFCFSPGPYYATYPERWCCWELVLHYLMMSHGGELLSRYRGLLQSYHEYVQSMDYRLKGYQEKFASLTGLESQVSRLQRQVASLNDKISSFGAAFSKSKAKGKERKKKIKSLTKSLDNLHAEVARLFANLNRATVLEAKRDEEILSLKATPWSLHPSSGVSFRVWSKSSLLLINLAEFRGRLVKASPLVAQTDYDFLNKIFEHAAEPLYVILQLEPEKLARLANVPASRDAHVSPHVEWANAMVDVTDHKMTDRAADANLWSMFVQGASHAVDNDVELTLIGSERVSSGLSDVVVALFIGGKGDGSLPSSTVDKEVIATSSGV
ncbi:hypothetical protein Tco_1390054 [Tanacetum coccineum]